MIKKQKTTKGEVLDLMIEILEYADLIRKYSRCFENPTFESFLEKRMFARNIWANAKRLEESAQILSRKLFPPEKYKIETSEELMKHGEIFKRYRKHDPDGFGYIPE